jgi:hypothetical protein
VAWALKCTPRKGAAFHQRTILKVFCITTVPKQAGRLARDPLTSTSLKALRQEILARGCLAALGSLEQRSKFSKISGTTVRGGPVSHYIQVLLQVN